MGSSITFGRIGGVDIGVSWTWLVIFGLIVLSLAAEVFPSTDKGLPAGTYLAMGIVGSVLFFASILLHELGHAVQARREGMEISGITLWLFGGVARFKGMFPSAGAELRIAIAGPLVTLVLGVGLVLLGDALALPKAVDGVVVWLGLTNLLLLGFNLLPALPLDGGRVLRSALWKLRGDLGWATEVAGAVSRMIGVLMIAIGIVMIFTVYAYGGIWLAFIGWFVIGAGAAETRFVAARQALAGLSVADAMAREPVAVPPGLTLQEFADRVNSKHRHAVYPVTDNGVILGLLVPGDLGGVAQDRWQSVRVAERMRPLGQVVFLHEEDGLADAVMDLVQADPQRAIVLRGTRLTGVLSSSDVQRIIELRGGLASKAARTWPRQARTTS